MLLTRRGMVRGTAAVSLAGMFSQAFAQVIALDDEIMTKEAELLHKIADKICAQMS